MKRRHKLGRGKSKRMFSRTAGRTHKKNLRSSTGGGPMRGGIRL